MAEFKRHSGFSLVELLVTMVLSLIILGAAVAVYSAAMGTRSREQDRTDAITSAQAALNVMSREIGNSGYGLTLSNGLVTSDCGLNRLRFRANVSNEGLYGDATAQAGEDVMYFLVGSGTDRSVVRYDRVTGVTSGIINQVSNVEFIYHNYASDGTNSPGAASNSTARITVTLEVVLNNIQGQPTRTERVSSDITLRNSPYSLSQY